MLTRAFRLPTPSLVISMLALGLVLGGTAAAASGLTTAGVTKLVKKLAPSLSVKSAKTATGLAKVTYVKGDVVDAPANGGSGVGEAADPSIATCPDGTVVIGSSAQTGFEGVEASPAGITAAGTAFVPKNSVAVYFDNFTNSDVPGNNYAIAICAPATSVANPDNLAPRMTARR